jgi:dTDP-4-dehydrorhamnose reductase
MRILVTGEHGQLARCLADLAPTHADWPFIFAGRDKLDLSQAAAARDAAIALKPDMIINTAAYTAVDKAESEAEAAFAINRDGAAAMAQAAEELGAALVHISTDYVFDGTKSTPYVERDPTGPAGVYARSKFEGEEAVRRQCSKHLILRTSWVYSVYGANFVKTMLRVGNGRPEVRVVGDQQGNPTSAHDLAAAILALVVQVNTGHQMWGTYHAAGRGDTTWHGFASEIFASASEQGYVSPRVTRITTAEYPTPAKRPANSRLDCGLLQRNFGVALPDWKDSARWCVENLLREAVPA